MLRRGTRIIILAALVMSALLAACSPYKAGRLDPAMGLPVINGAGAQGQQLFGSTDRWWEGFNDPALSALMERAFKSNLDLRQAYERLLQARAAAREAGASRLPALSASATGGRVRQPGQTGPVVMDTYSASLSMQYELDVWGKLGARTRAAIRQSEAATEALKAMYLSVSAQIAETYYTALEQRAQLALTEQTLASLDRIRRSVELRYSEGMVTALDVYQARQNLAMASTRKPAYEAALEAARAGLALALGQGPDDAPEIISTTITNGLPVPPPFPDYLPSDILSRRPDVQAALKSLQARDELVAAAVADRFPSFNLTGTYGGSSNTLSEVLNSPNIIWNALLSVSMPIFDGGRRKAASERSKAALRESLAAYHKTVLTALNEVHVALVRNQKTQQQIRLLEQSVTAGRNTLRVAEDHYMQGLTDYLNLLSAQQQLFSARSSLLSSRRQLISDRIQLARALGGSWMQTEIGRRAALNDNKEKANDNGQ